MKNIFLLVAVLGMMGCSSNSKTENAQGNVTASETGTKVKSPSANTSNADKVKAFSLAIQSHDLKKVQELLAGVPKQKAERTPADDELVNLGLYIATLDGMNCDTKIINLLEKEYGALVPKFSAVNISSLDKNDSDTPLCKDVMARSLPKMADKTQAVLIVNNHYVEELNSSSNEDLNKKAKKYNQLLKAAARLIAEACKESSVNPTCAVKTSYLDFANESKDAKISAVKKNATDVLKILGI